MDVFSVSVVFDSALVQVLANLEIASVQLAETQKTPEIEPKTLALHTRALNAQVAALRHLTALLDKLLRLQTPAAPAAGAEPPAPGAPAPTDRGADWGALPGEIPEFLKNISPPASPPQSPTPDSPPPTPASPSRQPNPQPPIPVSLSPNPNSPPPIPSASVSSAVNPPLTSPPRPVSDGRIR